MTSSARRRRLSAVFAALMAMPVPIVVASTPAVAAGTTRYVAASGSVGTGQSCASPGYVGATHASIQAAMNAASSGDIVHICAGTYAVSTRLEVTKTLTLRGAGAESTVLDGGATTQILIVQDAAIDDNASGDEITATVENMSFVNGYAQDSGSGLECVDGHRCGGAIFVENESRINVSGVHFENNKADFIGGAFARFLSANRYPTVASSITESSFEGNKANLDGGAIATLFGFGLTISRSTFYKNGLLPTWNARSGAAVIANFANATIEDSTIVDHDAPNGITVLYGDITVNRTLVAQTAGSTTNICNGSQTMGGSRGNLVTDGSCTGATQSKAAAGAGNSARVSYDDLKLGTFAYRGYGTKSVPLLSGSAALDHVTGCPATDQVGTSSPQGSSCDVGAVERPANQGLNTPTGWTYPSASIDRGYSSTMSVATPAVDPAGRGVDYASSTPGVCSINSSGRISATANGTCTVTATGPGWLTRDESTVSRTITVTQTPASSTTTTTTTTVPASTTTTAAPATTTVPSTTVASDAATTATTVATSSQTIGQTGSGTESSSRTVTAAPVDTAGGAVTPSTTPAPTTTTTVVPAPDAPEVAPGEAGATIDGESIETQLSRRDNGLVITAGSMSATVYGETSDGQRIALDADGNLQLDQGDRVVVEGAGFDPDSTVDIWLFSTPTRLGDLVASGAGTVSGSFAVPSTIESGSHRLVLEGTSSDGKDAVIGVGLYLGDYASEGGINRWLIIVPLVLATILGLVIPTTLRRRRAQLLNA